MATQHSPVAAPMTISARRRDYALDKLIGENDMYAIWEATRSIITDTEHLQKRRYRLHLLKESSDTLAAIPGIQAIQDEIRLLSYIYHKNCPYIEDAAEIDFKGKKSFFFAEHWWDGYSIKEIMLLAKHKSTPAGKFLIPIGAALWTAREIADALDHIHTLCDEHDYPLQIVHRDIRPEHIWYTNEGRVMLSGFSISKSTTNLFTTVAGQIRGISPYMAPERLTAEQPVNGVKADIFSLGCVLFEMIMGLPKMRITTAGLPDINSLKRNVNMRALRKNIHPRLEKVIKTMTMFEPEKRYDSAEDVRDEIDMLLDAPPYRCFASDIEGFVLYMTKQDREGYLAVQRLFERENKVIKENQNNKSIIMVQKNPLIPAVIPQTPPAHHENPPEKKELAAGEDKKNPMSAEQWADIQKSIDTMLQSSKSRSIIKHKQTLLGASILILIIFFALILIGINLYKKYSSAHFSPITVKNNSSITSSSTILTDTLQADKNALQNKKNGMLVFEIQIAQNASLIIQMQNIEGIKEQSQEKILQEAYKKIYSIDWNPYAGRHFIYKLNVTGN
jgi:serine/threonine protein kinase